MALQTLTNIRDKIRTAMTGAGFTFMEGSFSDLNSFHAETYPAVMLELTQTAQPDIYNSLAEHDYEMWVVDTFDQSEQSETSSNQDYITPKYDEMLALVEDGYTTLFAENDIIPSAYTYQYFSNQLADKLIVINVSFSITAHKYCAPSVS